MIWVAALSMALAIGLCAAKMIPLGNFSILQTSS
jgi:hypothetical protein